MYDYEKTILKPADDGSIKIDLTQIPEYQRRQLAEATLEATKRFFSQPGVEERYQAWLQERRKETAGE